MNIYILKEKAELCKINVNKKKSCFVRFEVYDLKINMVMYLIPGTDIIKNKINHYLLKNDCDLSYKY